MIYFTTRSKARKFAAKTEGYIVVDGGTESAEGRRWGVKVL